MKISRMLTSLMVLTMGVLSLTYAAGEAKELTDQEWSEMKRQALERQRWVIYDNDGDDAACFPKAKEVTPENYLALRTSFLHNYPVDTIVCNVTYGCFDQLFFACETNSLVDFDWLDWNPKATVVNIVPELIRQGTGVMEEQLNYAREHDIEFFAGIRINDVHDAADTPEKPVPFFSKWKRANMQWTLGGADRKAGGPYADWSGMDFSHKEVRDKFVTTVEAIVKRYPVDGIAIDLQRTCRFFRSAGHGEMPSAAEVEMLSEMFRRVRAVTESYGRRRGKPILLAIRGLDSIGYSLGVGFDWEGLMREGVFDIFFAGGTIHLQPWKKSVELCHRYGVKCYASIDEALCGFQAPRLGRQKPVSYFARIAGAYQQGVDGIYYFNLFNESCVREVMLGGPEKYRLLDKRYHLNPTTLWPPNYIIKDGARFNEFPLLSQRFKQQLAPGASMAFPVEFADDIAALKAEGFPVTMDGVLIASNPRAIAVASNGAEWTSLGAAGDTARFKVPEESFRPGLTTVVLTNRSAAPVEVVDVSIDLHLRETEPEALEPIAEWGASAQNATTLAAGNYAYQTTPMDAEVEVAVPAGKTATIYASLGGMLTVIRLSSDYLETPYSGAEPMPVKACGDARLLRFHVEEKEARLYLDGQWIELGTRSVSMALKGMLKGACCDLTHLEGELFTIVRNGGLAVDGDGAVVSALRLKMAK